MKYPSKENCRTAIESFREVEDRLSNVLESGTVEQRHARIWFRDRCQFVREFLELALKKLPSEAAFERQAIKRGPPQKGRGVRRGAGISFGKKDRSQKVYSFTNTGHEPHCPVPRAIARGENAVCQCRKPPQGVVKNAKTGKLEVTE